MFTRILVGLDGSEAAQRALDRAPDLAALCGAEVLVVSVEEKLPAYAATVGEIEEEERYEHRYFRRVQREARRQAGARGVPAYLEVVPRHPAQVLARLAAEGGCDWWSWGTPATLACIISSWDPPRTRWSSARTARSSSSDE